MPDLMGIHHITAITGDAPANVEFYSRLMGLRMVKKTVNYDAPEVYHLYYADEIGSPGSVLTFFEFPGARRGLAGAGMIHRISWSVNGEAALGFWADRLAAEGVAAERGDGALRFSDREGLGLELTADGGGDPQLSAEDPAIPADCALGGFHGVRAYAARPDASGQLLTEVLGFEATADGFIHASRGRRATYRVEAAPSIAPVQGVGTVHHVAWATADEEHRDWHRTLTEARLNPTPIIDRTYFRSIYFREPSGVLFEVATLGPGFAVDEPLASLGQALVLPPRYEAMRPWLERNLTPVTNPRSHNPETVGDPQAEQAEGEPVG